MSKFNPQDHLIKLQGKDYLQVQHRVQWFRTDHPQGSIVTQLLDYSDGAAVVQATVSADGNTLATGLAIANSNGVKAIWSGKEVMKAETAAIGRALAHAGYGTQFTGEDEGDFLADSPVENGKQKSKPKRTPSKKDGKPSKKLNTTQEGDNDASWHDGFIDWTKSTMGDEWSMPNVLSALSVSLDLVTCHEMADYPGDKARAMLAIGCWMIGYDDEFINRMVADYFPGTHEKQPEVFAEYLEIAGLNNKRYAKTEAGKQKQADKEAMF
jgi:hypothetical protein